MNNPGEPSNPPTPRERKRFGLSGRSVKLDKRIHAVRGDLADLSLAGTLFAPHYARAVAMLCDAPGTMVHQAPSFHATAVTQLLRGETFYLLDVTGEWAWGFCGHDGYVGYVPRVWLEAPAEESSHIVTAPSAPVFTAPDIKAEIFQFWPAGARFAGIAEGDFIATDLGYIHRRHADAIGGTESDWAAVAQRFTGMPYVWGGRGHGGIDCSGLVQVALARCGYSAPRDTDMQRDGIGEPMAEGEPLRRGDLVFFPGHVGIMADGEHLIHANAHWMAVVTEPLADVVARLAESVEQPILARRRIRT